MSNSRRRQRPRFDHSEPVAEQLRKWGEGKPLALAIIATQIAFGVDDCYRLVNMLRGQNGLFLRLRRVELEERLPFYESIWNVARSLLIDSGLKTADVDEAITWVRKLCSNAEVDQEGIRREIASIPRAHLLKAITAGCDTGRSVLDWVVNDALDTSPMDEVTAAEVAEDAKVPAIHFLLSVAMPCWVLTGQLPDRVLASAVQSERVTKQLRELIRIDAQVIHLPAVRDLLHPSARQLIQSRRKWLATTLTGEVHKISRNDIRYRFARLIGEFAERLAHPLKSPEIEEIILIAASVTRPEEICRECEIEPATFRDMTKRLNGFWELTPKHDKKARKSIDALRKAFS